MRWARGALCDRGPALHCESVRATARFGAREPDDAEIPAPRAQSTGFQAPKARQRWFTNAVTKAVDHAFAWLFPILV